MQSFLAMGVQARRSDSAHQLLVCSPSSIRLEGYTVDIDQASFGHELVEIETMSGSGTEDIEAASDGVAALAQSLGLTRDGVSGQATKVRALPAASAHALYEPSRRPVSFDTRISSEHVETVSERCRCVREQAFRLVERGP